MKSLSLLFNLARLNKLWFVFAPGSLILTLLLLACGDETPTSVPAAKVATPAPIPPSQTVINTPQPALNSTPAPAQLCQTKDLAIKASWQTNEIFWVEGSISFANQSGTACKLAGIAQMQVLDEQGQVLPVAQIPADNSALQPLLQPGQQVFVALLMHGGCKLFVEPDKGNFTLKVNFQDGQPDSSLAVAKILGIAQSTASESCNKASLQIGPYEIVAGAAFTATAVTGRQTAYAQYIKNSTANALTEKARPPSPTPTIIPIVPAGAKPCQAAKLKFDFARGSGGGGWSWGYIFLINTGPLTCTLQGFPDLQEVDEKGQSVPGFAFTKEDFKSIGVKFDTIYDVNMVVGVRPGKAAAIIRENFRCDYSPEPGSRTRYLILPQTKEKMILSQDIQHCPTHPYLGISPFFYAPDDWHATP